jgi:hypothetical protein
VVDRSIVVSSQPRGKPLQMLAMLLAATAGLAAAAAAVRPSPPSLSFRTPALVHNAGSTLASQAATLTADGRVIALPIGMPNANLALSTDAGASWVEQNVSGLGIDVNTTYSGKIKMPGDERWGGDHCPNPMRVGPAGKTRLLDRGLQRTDPKTNASWSMAPGTRTEYAWEGGKLTVTPLTGVEGAASFTGLPRKAVANEGVPSDLIRFAGGASLVLSADGRTILQTASFAFGDNPTSSYAQSTTAYLSTDGGNHFAYLSTVAAAGDYLDSQEGPGGEMDLALLPPKDGQPSTIVCVLRVDAGDGPRSHPYKPFHWTTSTDTGQTWTKLRPMNGTGCARPRLLLLGDTLLLSGGRMRAPVDLINKGGSQGVSVWAADVSDRALVQSAPPISWVRHDVSYWHNFLRKPSQYVWCGCANTSVVHCQQTSAYTSLVRVGERSAALIYPMYHNCSAHGPRHDDPPTPAVAYAMRIDVPK